jgi:hypothetical protein
MAPLEPLMVPPAPPPIVHTHIHVPAEVGLVLDEEQRARLKRFQADGLIFLVNTAVLHPRGLALALHLEDGEPIGLSIVGAGDEPWVYDGSADRALDELEDTLYGYFAGEARREREWSPKLRDSDEGLDPAEPAPDFS